MSKAVLVIDMPESCDECDFIDEMFHYCTIPWFGKDVSDYVICRHEECPFKEMPERIAIHPDDNEYLEGGKNGWNLCINQIMGKG